MALSYSETVGDGATTLFPIVKPFLSVADLRVLVNNVLQVIDTDYTFVGPTHAPTVVSFVTAPLSTETVRIARVTDISTASVDFENGSSLPEEDLNTAVLQLLYNAQEDQDNEGDTQALIDAISVDAGNLPSAIPSESFFILQVNTQGDWVKVAPLTALSNLGAGTAALLNTGTGSSQVPANSNLGSASLVNTGTGAGNVPLNSNLGTASTKVAGSAIGNLPILGNVGGNAALPAVDGSLLTNLPDPSAINAYVNFDGTDGSINKSVGITSVVRTGVGTYTITFDFTWADSDYLFFGSCRDDSASNNDLASLGAYPADAKGTTSIVIRTAGGALNDCPEVSIAFVGTVA